MDVPFRFKDLDPASPSKYLLNVFMPMPFGLGKNSFLVDRIDVKPDAVMAYLGEEMVTAFSSTFHFILINRDQYDVLTPEQIAAEQKKFEEDNNPKVPDDDVLRSPGRYTHL